MRSGHKVGKSVIAAVLSLWWVNTQPRGRVILTSASGRQVKNILWRELKTIGRRASPRLPGVIHEVPDAGYKLDDGREVLGFSTDTPERMAGESGDQLLFLIDEASGVPEEIFEAIEGNRAGGARVAMFSNPTQTSGTFFEAFHSKRAFWHTVHVSSEEAAEVDPPIPGLATKTWIAEKLEEWGEDSPLYQVRARGNFPGQADNAVVSLARLTTAIERFDDDVQPMPSRLEVGVDVARYGDDDSVIVARRGGRAWIARVVHGFDTVEVAGAVLAVVRDQRRDDDLEPPRLKVDVIGVGAGVADQLRQHEDVEVVDINVAENATSDGYHRLRDQIWFATSSWLESGALKSDAQLEAELVCPTYRFDAQGRQQVESKDEIKRKLKRSPDRADGLGLAVYEPPSSSAGLLRGGRSRR